MRGSATNAVLPINPIPKSAEYKQVTVLFADVVHSMDIAAAVGPKDCARSWPNCWTGRRQSSSVTAERWISSPATASWRCSVPQPRWKTMPSAPASPPWRFRRTIGADAAPADRPELGSGHRRRNRFQRSELHGHRRAGWDGATDGIGGAAGRRDAQRVDGAAGGEPSSARRARISPHQGRRRSQFREAVTRRSANIGRITAYRIALVGRSWELNTVTGILEEAIGGAGYVVGVMGPPGIGKSRLIRETAAIAAARGVEVYHRPLRISRQRYPISRDRATDPRSYGYRRPGRHASRRRIRERFADADDEDLLLLDDLLGMRDMAVALPEIAADARRRRLTALSTAPPWPARRRRYTCIEDVHWIDETSESMMADFLAVIPQTPSLVLVTYRPEYRGASAGPGGPDDHAAAAESMHTPNTDSELMGRRIHRLRRLVQPLPNEPRVTHFRRGDGPRFG